MPILIAVVILIIIYSISKVLFFTLLSITIIGIIYTWNKVDVDEDNCDDIVEALPTSVKKRVEKSKTSSNNDISGLTRSKIKKIKNSEVEKLYTYQSFNDSYDAEKGLLNFLITFRKVPETNFETHIDKMLEKANKDLELDDFDLYNSIYFSVLSAYDYFYSSLLPHEKEICKYIDDKWNKCFTFKYEILEVIIKNPDFKQTALYKIFPEVKKNKISDLLVELAECDTIIRTKSGNTYMVKFNKLSKNKKYNNYNNEFISNNYSTT